MPSLSNISYLIIAKFLFVFLNTISISEVSKQTKLFKYRISHCTDCAGFSLVKIWLVVNLLVFLSDT